MAGDRPDVSDAAVERVRELGLPVLAGSLPHPALDRRASTLITMWHSLEHVHSPLEVLRGATRLLAPGGTLLVAVPNIDSLHSVVRAELVRVGPAAAPDALLANNAAADGGSGRLPLRPAADGAAQRLAALVGEAGVSDRAGEPVSALLRIKPASRLATWYTSLRGKADCMLLTARAD
jgi:SAM-dependent methyltransferase